MYMLNKVVVRWCWRYFTSLS